MCSRRSTAVLLRRVTCDSHHGIRSRAEKLAVNKAHADVHNRLARLKEMAAAGHVPTHIKTLVDDIDKIEHAYSPVALKIVDLALNGQRDDGHSP